MDDVLWQRPLGGRLDHKIARLDVDRTAALLGDAGELRPQNTFVVVVHEAAGARRRRRLHHATGVAGVVHDKQLVGLVGDRLEHVRHFAVGDVAADPAVIGKQGLDAATGGRVVVARAMARIVDEHPVAVLHLVGQLAHRGADVAPGGLVILQVLDVSQRHLHRLRHLGCRLLVDARARQRRRGRVGVAADADDQGMAVDTRRQAANPQCQGGVAACLAAGLHVGGGRTAGLPVDCASANPARQVLAVTGGFDQDPAALRVDQAQHGSRRKARQHACGAEFVAAQFGRTQRTDHLARLGLQRKRRHHRHSREASWQFHGNVLSMLACNPFLQV